MSEAGTDLAWIDAALTSARPQTLAALALHCLEHPAVAQYVRHKLAILRHTLGTGEGARRAAVCVGQFLQAAEMRAAATVEG